MRSVLFAIVMLVTIAKSQAQNQVSEQFVYHQLDVLDAATNEVLESNDDFKGVVVSVLHEGKEYLLITFADEKRFTITIVDKSEKIFDEMWRIKMYQGGEKIDGSVAYTAKVFFYYNIHKNTHIPEAIHFVIDRSPYSYQLSGIMKLNNK